MKNFRFFTRPFFLEICKENIRKTVNGKNTGACMANAIIKT